MGGWVDLDSGVGTIVAPHGPPDACWMAVHHCLRPLWFFALARRGLHAVHAAGVAVGQDAALILGSSGAGKSTLAARFVGQGAALLSDDMVLLDHESLDVSGFGDPCRLRDGFGPEPRIAPDPDGKRASVVGAVTTGPARPSLLLFLDATETPEPISRHLPPGDVMVQLLRSGFLSVDPDSDPSRVRALARLAEHCPALEVHRGPRHPSPATVRSWLGQLCASG